MVRMTKVSSPLLNFSSVIVFFHKALPGILPIFFLKFV